MKQTGKARLAYNRYALVGERTQNGRMYKTGVNIPDKSKKSLDAGKKAILSYFKTNFKSIKGRTTYRIEVY
ncbi:MAG: hypothetical protein M0R51_08200 [Clostridia bacterium]|jgi:hypothetical protein|nr:hypothetical protein [Clostridia bacterium]